MQLLALGKWSKADNGWKMVVAMRRSNGPARTAKGVASERPATPTRRPDGKPEPR